MAYDERLAEELRERLLEAEVFFEEKQMFGGLAFLVEGNLTIAASRQGGLLVRTDPDEADETLVLPGVRPMEPAGRRMPGCSPPATPPASAAPSTSSPRCRRSRRRARRSLGEFFPPRSHLPFI